MSFRGFGDDALKVKADKREAALKAAQIAASERASMRSANVQMARVQESARQADMVNQRADDVTAQSEEQRKIDLGFKLEEQSRHERQLQLNERVAARLEQEWQQKQAVQEEIKNVGKATHLAVMRAAVRADGPVDQVFVNAWNTALNVGPGEPGYVKQITAVRDPKTQENYGVGFLSVGQEGEDVYTVKNPGDIMPLLRASMSPDAWDKWSYDTLNQRKSAGIDATSAAILKEKEKGKLELSAKQALEIAKGAQGVGEEMNPKTDQANLDKINKITSGALDAAAAAMQGPQPEQPAPKFPLEDQAIFTQAMTDAKGDRDKAKELYKAAKAKQAEVAKRRAGGGETTADEAAGGAAPTPAAGGAAPTPAAAEKAEAAPTPAAGGAAPASQPATKNAGKQKSWTTPSSTPLFERGADGKRGKANVEPGKDTQRLGSNKAPAAVELRFTKQQEESLTDEDRQAIAKIHVDSLNLEEDPDTGLVPDRETYRKQKVMEYFQQKFETEFKRLFGEGKFETEFKRRFGGAPK